MYKRYFSDCIATSSAVQSSAENRVTMCVKGQLGERSPGARLLEAAIEDSSVEAVWKMYSAARASLPYKERVDNLTWRMLGMRVRRMQESAREMEFVSSSEPMDVSVDPMNTVLTRSPGPHDSDPFAFSHQGHSAGFVGSAGLHDQFELFDTAFDEQMDDQLIMEFSRSSPAVASETSDSYAREVLAGQGAGSLLRADPSNFLDHFFPSSIMGMGDGSDGVALPPTPAATAKPKKLRQQNSTVTQARRGSGVKKKPQPLRNASTTSLTSLNSDLGTPGPGVPQEAGREPAKDGSKSTRCSNCHTRNTPLWRRDPAGNPLCNACGLFLKLHGVVRPLSLKTDVIKKRQRNSNTSKQAKSTSPNLEDPRQTRKTPGSSSSRRKSTARETSSMSPVTLVNSLSRVNSNLEANNDAPNFNDNITHNANDDNNTNNSHFDFFPQADLPTMEDSTTLSHSSNVGIGTGIEKPPRDDESRPQRNDATGNTNWEWLSLSL
ncbi:hypothetical protein HG536_0B06460 [Torulaspora globosa]|uniref:GATA-type domain-containing protein n=1 Tax=Torulaspora globosa TaxID=48254 RepID=A0A7G3ZE42_9SACH|nr:uncharacterized protein HG536_0B06460 [Torulaspora globosa]QLL31778.1 hypothetical protein HG536_0B06460 [Torulaspora globosa]